MHIPPYFTKLETADDAVFTQVKSEIRNADGSIVFNQDNLTVPEEWSQVACDILAQKYFRKKGVPIHTKRVEEEGMPEWLQRRIPDPEKLEEADQRFGRESDARAVFHRMAGAWTWGGVESRLFHDRTRCSNFL